MQQTRLNIFISDFTNQFRSFLQNPWRKLSFVIIGSLLGFSLPTVLTSSVSQSGEWDVTVALVFLLFTELLHKIINSFGQSKRKPWWTDILYSFKIGFTYGLYLDGVVLTS